MRVIYSATHLLHDPAFEVTGGRRIPAWEVTGRAEAIRAALDADAAFVRAEPDAHGPEPIAAVHEPGLVRYLESAWSEWRRHGTGAEAIVPDTIVHPALRAGMGPAPEPTSPCGRVGYWCYDTATPIVPGTYLAARAAVDVALTSAAAVLGGERAAYGLCRPPGHHAARAMFGGYCYFNNAAIAAEWLVRQTGGPIAVLDLDYHHGNGTQQIFWERPDVAYASLHADPNRTYPYYAGHATETGAGAGAGATFNQPLAAGTTDAEYLDALDRALDWLAGRPGELLVLSLGMDTYGQDPIGDFALTTPVYHEVGRRVAASGRPLVILQEGGYHVPALGENVRQWLRGADGRPLDLGPRRSDGPTAG